jgi:23S rRNA pseudouridine2605 synthase
MRINQYLAAATGLSRRAADAAIAAGRVHIDGQPATLGAAVNPGQNVFLDGQPVHRAAAHHYVLLHKPAGYVSSRQRQGSDPTIYQLLPDNLHNLRLAGRLDRDSSGLLLLSDDGDFVHRYTHPSFNKLKVYELVLARPLAPADRRRLEAGVTLEDGPSRVGVTSVRGRRVTVTLTEGRNRQLRRTFGALGYTVEQLVRTHIGSYQLDGLPTGAWAEVVPQ